MEQLSKKEFDLEYEINYVKDIITKITNASTGSYNVLNHNDLLNTYSISAHISMQFGIMNITLKDIDGKTKYTTEIVSAAGSKVPAATLSQIQDEFLNIFSKALKGETINSELINKNKSGCIVMLIITASTALLTACMICR